MIDRRSGAWHRRVLKDQAVLQLRFEMKRTASKEQE